MTPEQLQALAGMGDIGGDEDVMQQQMDLADKLRAGYLSNPRKDVGSQIGKAALGIGGALGTKAGLAMNPQIASKKQGLLASLLRAYGGGGNAGSEPPAQEMGY